MTSTSLQRVSITPVFNRRVLLWLVAFGSLATLLAVLTVVVRNNPGSSADVTVLAEVSSWHAPGLTGFSKVINVTNNWPAVALGSAGIAFLWLLGRTREAFGFAVIGGIVGLAAFAGDLTLGEIVGRSRPLGPAGGPSFPSGHVFGSTVFFGFWGFLAVHFGLNKKLLALMLALLGAMILAVGFVRIYEQAHWPSDVAAGYLLGGLWLLALIPFFLYIQRVSWLFPTKNHEDLSIRACESCRVETSIASTVFLDPERGTATKIYRPPGLVRILYWLAFQARFPYESNIAALHAAQHRRKIAGLLTLHRFGKDLVAPATTAECIHGRCSFVTEFVPGEKVENDEAAREFLGQVAETFAEAGLSVWQVNPRNPHAHTNLIRTPSGDLKIIDLESAIVTLFPAPGQWRSALKRGNVPVFDDIDFERMRRYVAANALALEGTLGPEGVAELRIAVNGAERAIREWKDAEPRIWGRLISRTYRLLDWKAHFQHMMHAMVGANRAAETFLSRGLSRWERDGRLAQPEAASLWARLASVRGSRRPLSPGGAPGAQHGDRRADTGHEERGAVAYLASRPLRHKLLVRLMIDQTAWSLPFGLYRRLHLYRWLAPSAGRG
ncbi:MAG: phosphatase PAP2 family protein [Dehalococcoidia bacterium]